LLLTIEIGPLHVVISMHIVEVPEMESFGSDFASYVEFGLVDWTRSYSMLPSKSQVERASGHGVIN
jgi:hypothetical protein